MDEYAVRTKTKEYIDKGINESIKRYYDKYKDNIGFLLYYPLMNLEMRFMEEDPHFHNAIIDRAKTSWFIKNILSYNINNDLIFSFKQEEFEYYRKVLYLEISKLYRDYKLAKEIGDNNSIGRCKIEKVSDNTYRIISALVSNEFSGGRAYYYGIYDEQQNKYERNEVKKPIEYLSKKFMDENPRKFIRKTRRLIIDIDKELYDICKNRVNIDTSKLGKKLKSVIINKTESLNNILGFLFYISQIKIFSLNIERIIGKKIDITEAIINVEREWLVNKIKKVSGLNLQLIEKYIDYFSYKGEGTIFEFPIVSHGNKLIIIPSLIILNDWQFSITNGHKARNIQFKNMDKSISKSIVEDICSIANRFNNIVIAKEKYYEFIDKNSKINSDIDVALYDIKSNKILVIECKWKHNHYIDDDEENYIKIQDTLNTIYKEQIYKHKTFLECNKNNVNFIFDYNKNIRDVKEIYYLAVDKRSELHIGNYHMVSLYTLLTLFNIYSNNNELDIDGVINKIDSMQTKVEYFITDEEKKFVIDGESKFSILNDELYGDYNGYFK